VKAVPALGRNANDRRYRVDQHPTAVSQNNEPDGPPSKRRIDRRTLAIAAGTGIVTIGAWRVGLAQTNDDADSTPQVTDSATPTAGEAPDTFDAERLADVLENIDADLAWVQADRDAVASSIDTATVDVVLADAENQRVAAQTALDGDDAESAMRYAGGARLEVQAASTLIEAQLSYAGLPSQESQAGRALTRAYEVIIRSGEAAGSDGDVDISFQVATAQELYGTAYEHYGNGSFAQAALTASGAADLAQAGLVLVGEGGFGGDGMFRGEDRMQHAERGLTPDDEDAGEAGATPTTDDTTDAPPAPDFGT
jgi:hypothetical protein